MHDFDVVDLDGNQLTLGTAPPPRLDVGGSNQRDRRMPNARLAQESDLAALLDLFRASEVSAAAQPQEEAEDIWRQTLSRDDLAVFVSTAEVRIVATCMLITAPNLLRTGRRHGFLENVVTHPEFWGCGHGRAVVAAALQAAWTKDCHHVLLQSGRKDPRVHRFYERCGFEPGLRIGYVARRPDGV
jgi:GNAT superfamily N-acetyltransferase